jgi:prepilin-type N-terminal cleavage/methylation domain-containing protein
MQSVVHGVTKALKERKMKRSNSGFTLVEIMIVVAIIGLLAAIAIPSFVNARIKSQQNSCINNLRQISGAKDQYALDKNGTAPTALSDLVGYDMYIAKLPSCPASGTYAIGALGADPTCTVNGHTI